MSTREASRRSEKAPSHMLDSPFGCPFSWGPSIRVLPDMGWHICNLPIGHKEVLHICKCGAEHQ